MERTTQGPRSKLSTWVIVGAAAGVLLAGAALWLDVQHEYQLELQAHQALLAASGSQAKKLLLLAQEALERRDAPRFPILEGWSGGTPMALVRWDGAGGVSESLPSEAAAWLPRMLPTAPQGSWVFVEPGQEAAGGMPGLVAYLAPQAGQWQALVVDLPRLLLDCGLGEGAAQTYFVALKVPGAAPRLFGCERAGVLTRNWRCSPQRWLSERDFGDSSWGTKPLASGNGVLLTYSLAVDRGVLGVGLWMPETGFWGRISPGWVLILVLAFLTTGGGVLLRHFLWSGERQQAKIEADLARREAELAAHIAEAQWRLLLDGVKEPILFVRDEFVVRSNQAASKLLGFEHPGDCIGARFLDLVVPEERARVAKLLPAAAASLGSFTAYLQGCNGRRRTVEVHPWKLEVGGEVVTALSLKDLTGRERAESLLRVLLANLGVGVAFLDPRGKVRWANSALAQALGLRPEDLLRQDLLPFASPPAWRVVRRAFARSRRGEKQTATVPCRLVGQVVEPVTLVLVPVPLSGNVSGVLLVASRTTGSSPESRAEEALSLVEAVVARQTHHCANLLQVLMGDSPKGRGSKVRQQALEELARALRRMSALFRVPGREVTPVELNAKLQSVAKFIQGDLPGTVRLLLRPWDGPAWVAADEELLEFFLMEACAVGLQAIGEGVGTLELAVERLPSGRFRLAVADTGEVLHLEEKEVATFPVRLYSRAVAWLVGRALGGGAGFRERQGFGARVWIDLPEAASLPIARAKKGTSRMGRILVAEDEPLVREGLVETLRAAGYEVEEASGGQQALELLRRHPTEYALVVLDLVMPEVCGRAVYEEVLKVPSPPVVLLATGYVPREDPILAALPTLVKPFTLEAFLQEVERLVGPPPRRSPSASQ